MNLTQSGGVSKIGSLLFILRFTPKGFGFPQYGDPNNNEPIISRQ